jgi:hypothetical protein
MSLPDNFVSTINDFTNDLSTTFPEYSYLWNKWRTPETSTEEYQQLFNFLLNVYPERFFDILYQNVEIFAVSSQINTQFLPNVDFRLLWCCEGVSNNTKQTIWKYLQLILFIVIGSVKDKTDFGETANLFEGVDEKELHSKMEETMSGLTDFFKNMGVDMDANIKTDQGEPSPEQPSFEKPTGMPDMEGLHEHLKGLFDGKIGKLAKELAEEISGEFENLMGDAEDSENAGFTTQDVLKKLMKNPKKMMDLVKKVGDKLKNKMDSGDISKDDIMKEAADIMKHMKEMGGGKNFQEMFKDLAAGMGKNVKIDTNALNRMTKMEEMKERMRKKANKKDKNFVLEPTDNPNNFVFRVPGEETQERSSVPPVQKPSDEELIAMFNNDANKTEKPTNSSGKKKKKGKK